jgi:sodium/potassium-transporting ATPase subunit alpha
MERDRESNGTEKKCTLLWLLNFLLTLFFFVLQLLSVFWQTNNVRLEISSLTGESAPLSGTAEPSRPETPVHESRCMAFSGSVCLQGLALALVVRTGDRTMIGQIAALAASNAQRPAASSLEREMTYFVRFVAILAFVTAAVFFLIGLGRQGGDNALNLFINGFLIVIVANVPQGLPATVTSLLAITAKRMAAQNVFVKRLDVIEALGAASVICSDKTGTLTQNVMTVRELFCNGMTLTAGFETHFSPPAANLKSSMRKKNDLAVNWLGIVAAVCNGASRTPPAHNAATLVAVPADPAASKSAVAPAPAAAAAADAAAASSTSSSSDDHDQFLGSPSEVALLRFVGQYVSVETLRSQYEILAEIPFNSANKWHMMVCAPRNTDPLVR